MEVIEVMERLTICKVSVITVTYNAEACIRETMLSVLLQKYDDFEYIIKDGQSSDNTNTIVQNIKQKFNKKVTIKHICTKDKGIYDAMNEAVKYACGEWIIFMNAGDTFYDRNVLSNVFSMQHVDEADILYGHVLLKLKGNRGLVLTYNSDAMKKGISICHQAVFEKKELLVKNAFDLDLKILADREHFLRLMNCGTKFHRINIIVAKEDRNGISSVDYPQCCREVQLLSKKYNLSNKKKNIQLEKIKMFIKLFIPQIEETILIYKSLKRNV